MVMESAGGDSLRTQFEQFLANLTDFKTPVEAISELPKHGKVDGRASWTEAEMESELVYAVQLYLTHLGCPLEYTMPCARAVVIDVLDSNFRLQDFEAPPPLLTAAEGDNGDDWHLTGANGHGNGHGESHDTTTGQPVEDHSQPEKPVLSAKNLHTYAVLKANELLARWKQNTPNIDPVRLPHGISVHAMKNKRPCMEDRHVIIPDLRAVVDVKGIKSPVSFYAVYDGHAGAVAASYAAAHLHRRLCASDNYPDHMESALREAFLSTDKLYAVKGVRDKDQSGTTAVVTVVYENKLYIAWVGDSEATVVQNGFAAKLVEPRHVADNEAERNRVKDEGGSVIVNQGGWRVAAVLTVTRAIGDSSFKPFVTAQPDIRTIELDGSEDYLILACDGLWDELSPESAMKATNSFLLKNPDRIGEVAKELAEKARKSGSLDNITVIVVLLKPIAQLLEELQNRSIESLQDTSMDGLERTASSGSHDDFADLVDSTDFPVEFDPTAHNPFDTTPLDSSVLGDFGTPSDRSASEIDWDFKPVQLNLHDEESQALNALDQVIAGATNSDAGNLAASQELINFDSSPGVTPSVNGEFHDESRTVVSQFVTEPDAGHAAPDTATAPKTAPPSQELNLLHISTDNSRALESNERRDKETAAYGDGMAHNSSLAVEPNSGSSPLPASAAPAKSHESAAVEKPRSVKDQIVPVQASPKPSADSKTKPQTPARLSTNPAVFPPKSTVSKTNASPDAAGPKRTLPPSAKPGPSATTVDAKKAAPLASARKLPTAPATPRPGAGDKTLEAGVKKTVATTAVPASSSRSAAAGNGVTSAGPTPSVGRTPATARTPAAKIDAVKSKELHPRTPDAPPLAADNAKPAPATPRNTPVVMQKRLVPATKTPTTSAGEKPTSLSHPPASKTDGKTVGTATSRAGVPTTPDSKKAMPTPAARPATTHAAPKTRPVTVSSQATTSKTTSGTSISKTIPTTSHNGNGLESPKTKTLDTKSPSLPTARPRADHSAGRTPISATTAAPKTPRLTPATPRPKPATDSTPKIPTKPLLNGDKPTGSAAKRPSALTAVPKKTTAVGAAKSKPGTSDKPSSSTSVRAPANGQNGMSLLDEVGSMDATASSPGNGPITSETGVLEGQKLTDENSAVMI